MITILPLIMLKSSFLVIAKLKIAPDSWESDKSLWITFLIPKAYPHKNSKSNKSSYNPNPKLTIKNLNTGKNKRKPGVSFNCKTCDFEIKIIKLK